jgi:hypothetical protein
MSPVIDPSVRPEPAADYTALRAAGYAAIERLANQQWTDYNAHDPGITLWEHLADALAEIGYRGSFDVADLLTGPGGGIDHRQPFFTAGRIMTNAPVTDNDFRRLLIDSLTTTNAWLVCKKCACAPLLHPECREDGLRFAPGWRLLPDGQEDEHETPVQIKGFTDVYLQFAEDPELGNLNNDRVSGQLMLENSEGNLRPVGIEIRFPRWEEDLPEPYRVAVQQEAEINMADSGFRDFRRDQILLDPVDDVDLRRGIRDIFYLDLRLNISDGTETIIVDLPELTVRFWTNDRLAAGIDGDAILAAITATDFLERYHRKIKARAAALAGVSELLHNHRKLGEDYCRTDRIIAEDVAVCADVHLSPGADVELTLAHFYRTVERLLNPPVPFRTLSEMEELGKTTEEIFNGPWLERGFILDEDLENSRLRSAIYVSDLLNELMDIEGIVTIENLRFTVYDETGQPISPAHDWCIPVSPGHYAALYVEASAVSPYKDGLPLLARRAELRTLLTQLRADDLAQELPVRERDYAIPTGSYQGRPAYLPVQRTLPVTYGLSVEGLPESATTARKAQARQLAGYLSPFELITAATADQLTYFGDLFSTDENVGGTYRHPELLTAGGALSHYEELLADPISFSDVLADLTEPVELFEARRNRFLDHVLARFGESMQNYTLLIHDQATRRANGPDKLIQDKVRFLRFLPEITSRRGQGFNYRLGEEVCGYPNRGGLADRIRRLLGMEDVRSYFSLSTAFSDGHWQTNFQLVDDRDTTEPPVELLYSGGLAEPAFHDTAEAAEAAAWERIELLLERARSAANYRTIEGNLYVTNTYLNDAGDSVTEDLAALTISTTSLILGDFITARLADERLFVVEHLLLRPKFPGDALLEVCLGEDCVHHGLEDPYSFRLTYLLPAAAKPYSEDMDLRRYAEQLIRRETPVHLLPKLCWIGDELADFENLWCTWLKSNASFNWPALNDELERLVMDWLEDNGITVGSDRSSTRLLLGYFGDRLRAWMKEVAENNVNLPADLASIFMDGVWPAVAPADAQDFGSDLLAIQANDPALWLAWGSPNATRLAELRTLLEAAYADWLEVSFHLHRLLIVFQSLRSIYPVATLHDCDDGDDENPVRLNQTTLGTQSND